MLPSIMCATRNKLSSSNWIFGKTWSSGKKTRYEMIKTKLKPQKYRQTGKNTWRRYSETRAIVDAPWRGAWKAARRRKRPGRGRWGTGHWRRWAASRAPRAWPARPWRAARAAPRPSGPSPAVTTAATAPGTRIPSPRPCQARTATVLKETNNSVPVSKHANTWSRRNQTNRAPIKIREIM